MNEGKPHRAAAEDRHTVAARNAKAVDRAEHFPEGHDHDPVHRIDPFRKHSLRIGAFRGFALRIRLQVIDHPVFGKSAPGRGQARITDRIIPDKRQEDLVPDFVADDIPAHGNDFTDALMPEHDRILFLLKPLKLPVNEFRVRSVADSACHCPHQRLLLGVSRQGHFCSSQ